MKMLINTKEKTSKKMTNISLNTSSSSSRQTNATSFYLNPPKSPTKPKQRETSLVDTVINYTTPNIQSSGSSINLASNHVMSCSLSSSSGLVENSSRSSSSIDTGSNTNTDELLNAGNDLIAENSDLSDGSSQRSSLNDIGIDVELEQNRQQQPADYFQKSNTESLKAKAKKHRQNNYFSRNRRSRIAKSPPIEWNKVNSCNNEDDRDSGKISDQLDSPKSEKKQFNSKQKIGATQNQELYDYYLKNRNHGIDREDEEIFVKVNTSNYSNIENLKLKFGDSPSHKIGKLNTTNKSSVTSWLTGASYSEVEDSSFKQNTKHRSQTQQTSKSFDLGISSKAQQQDKPVFKYLSKNLINNLFVKESAEHSKSSKSSESIGKPLTVTTVHDKPHGPPSINYNYLVNKYSPSIRSESYRLQMSKLSNEKKQNNLDTTSKINSSIVSIIKDLVSDVIEESSADQKQNLQQQQVPRFRSGKVHSDELEVAVTVELESDEDFIETDGSSLNFPQTRLSNIDLYSGDNDDEDGNFLTDDKTFKNTERNRGYLSPRERINAAKLNIGEQESVVQSKPLIKTLINDITKLKNDTYLTSCLDYLNQNFNKALDDLVELEDSKKTTTRGENNNLEINYGSSERQNDINDYETIKLSNNLVNISTKYQQINEKQKNNAGEEDLKTKNNNLRIRNEKNKLSFNFEKNLTKKTTSNANNNIYSNQQILLDEQKHNQNNKVDVQVEIEVEVEESENEEVKESQIEKNICNKLHEKSERELTSDNHKDFGNHVSSIQQLSSFKKNNAKIDASETYNNNKKSCSTKTTNLIIPNSNITLTRNPCNTELIDSNFLNNYAELYVQNIEIENRDSVRTSTTKLHEIKEVKDEQRVEKESEIDNRSGLNNNEASPSEACTDLDNINKSTEDICTMKRKNKNKSKKVANELVNLQEQQHQLQNQPGSFETICEKLITAAGTSLDNKLESISTHSMEVIEANGDRDFNREAVLEAENDSSIEMKGEELLKSCSIVSDVIEDEIEQDTSQSINKKIEEAFEEVSSHLDNEINSNINAALDSLIGLQDSLDASSMSTNEIEIEDKNDKNHVDVVVETNNNSQEYLAIEDLKNNNIQPENELNKINKGDDESSASKVSLKLDQDIEAILNELIANSESSLKASNDSDNLLELNSFSTNEDSRNLVDDREKLQNEQALITTNENCCSTTNSNTNEENENITKSKLTEVEKEEKQYFNKEKDNLATEKKEDCKESINLLCYVGDDGVEEVQKKETSSNLNYYNEGNSVVEEEKLKSTISITTESIIEKKTHDNHKLETNNTETEITSCNEKNTTNPTSDISVSLPQQQANILTKDPIEVLDNKCEILDESDELSINKLSAIEKIHTDSENGDVESHLIKLLSAEEKLNTSNTINTFDDSIDSANSTQKDQDESLMASGIDDEEAATRNDRKILLRNKDIVLVESCSDDDEEDLKRIIRRKNESPAEELFPVLVAQERKAARQRKAAANTNFSPLDDFLNLKSSTFVPSTASSFVNTTTSNAKTNTTSNDEDDPFVKAALERFDAFCKSKSSQNLDQTGTSNTSSMSPLTPSPSILQRQKSPFLTRRTITQKSDEPNMKENIGSFIKRRQARIDPNLLRNKSSTPNGSDSESKNPTTTNKPPLMSRSVSETRDYSENPFTSNSLRADKMNELKQQQAISSQESSLSSMNSSNLAKRFLGSLTPQLEPMKDSNDTVNLNTEKNSDSNQEQETQTIVTSPRRATQATGTSLINRTNSAPSTTTLSSLRANYRQANEQIVSEIQPERRASTSSNSSTDEIKSPRGNNTVNHIKLEVVNSKSKTPSPEKQQINSKPPLPPVPSPVTTAPTAPTSWRSTKTPTVVNNTSSKAELDQDTVAKPPTTPTTTVITKPTSQKPGVRMIPLEVKNTKSRVIPLEVKTNGSPSLSRSNSRCENKILNNSFNVTSPVTAKQTENNGSFSSNCSPEKDEESLAESSIFNRPRSAGSFRIERDVTGLSGTNLRTASSFSYRDATPSLNSNLSNSHSGNLNSNTEHYRQLPTDIRTKTDDTGADPADPIVEKACSNFMYKLMEFQRHQKLYSPYTATVAKSDTISGLSPMTPTSSLYPETILKPATFDYSSRPTTEISSSPYTSLYTPSSLQTSLSSQSSLNRYESMGARNTYRTDLSKYSSESLSSDPTRPYVSAIRKRRTLFEDLQSTVENQERLTNQYLIPQASEDLSDCKQQPLSIVSEELNGCYHGLSRSLSAKGESRNSEYGYKSSIDSVSTSAYSRISSRPPLRKAGSTTTPPGSNSHEPNSNEFSGTVSSASSTSQPKLRSTVFDRLAALNSVSSTKNSLVQKSNSNLNLNLETPEVLTKNSKSRVIKDQNEIAVVTSMTSPTPKKDTSQYSSSGSSTTLNRIRSLDSKSREKLKTNKEYLNKKTTDLASSKLTISQKNLTETSTNSSTSRRLKTVGVTSHLPPPAPTSTSPTPSNYSSNSNSSFKVDHSTASSTSTSTVRTDVFDRLSKRTNSLKNLSSNNNEGKITKTKKFTRSRNSPSSSDHDTDTGKSSPTCSHNEDHQNLTQEIETTQNTIANSATNQNSKTSVFERLYKSNIAAQQSLKNQENSNETSNASNATTVLRKNMSNSTHSLATTPNGIGLSRKSNWTPRGRSNLARSKAVSSSHKKTEEMNTFKACDQEDQSTSSSN